MTTSSQLNPLSLADVKADASSFGGNALEPGAYMIKSAAWPHLMLGLRDGVEKEGNPVDTILALHSIGPKWDIEARPAGSTTTFTIRSQGGHFQHVEKISENAGVVVSATETVFKIVQPLEAHPTLYSIQVGDGEFAFQAVSGAGADQVVLQPFNERDTRQLWVFARGLMA
ncbi:hypothetical protein PC9H_005662 [Pleurotus ostreatus]|uniref:Uncharacterized protein n=1 Tax=Pleurotus ostreatus TaxID=5322 RepID=A0A8H7A0B8_PLEOS|nr:uncharacterized protein PC9H_005662 [Pleurotus ostreatus]KAF7433699.1 hypothetical protein PC9H_005662 [Pleurotus ostreatus]KAJ8697542.1 hypothetical protein PTI98_004335 [Pleurotus ostreatus]